MELLTSLLHQVAAFIIILSVIVFIHEFGHYIIAKWCGVKIDAFSIGFGRELWGRTDKSGTRWKISLLPLGGYVKMYGDASAASNADESLLENLTPEEKRVTFHHKPLWQKAAVVAAGPISNFILTIVILTYFILTSGIPSTEPIVGDVMPDSPAQAAGLQSGDRVVSINGKDMHRFSEIPLTIATNLGTPVDILIDRKGEQKHITLSPTIMEEEDALGNMSKRPLIGIRSAEIKYEDVNIVQAVGEATRRTYIICTTTLEVVGQMITGDRGVSELKGPVGIAQISGQAAEKGWMTVLWLIAMLSANLGLVNLFPVPLLDGGHLAYYAAEAASGRPLAKKVQEYGYRVGFALIVTLMAFTLFNDLKHIFFS